MKKIISITLTSIIMITLCSCNNSGGRLPNSLSYKTIDEVESYFTSSDLSDDDVKFINRGIALHKNMRDYLDKNPSSYASDAWMKYAGGRIDPLATVVEWKQCEFYEDKLSTASVLLWSSIARDIVNGGRIPDQTALQSHGSVTMLLIQMDSWAAEADSKGETMYRLMEKHLRE